MPAPVGSFQSIKTGIIQRLTFAEASGLIRFITVIGSSDISPSLQPSMNGMNPYRADMSHSTDYRFMLQGVNYRLGPTGWDWEGIQLLIT